MKTNSVMRRFERSLEITKSAKKQIWQALAFLLIVAGLLYYICTRTVDVVGLRPGRFSSEDPVGSHEGTEDFFAEFRLSREKIQKEQMDLVKKVMDDKNASPQVRDEAYLQYLAIVDAMGKELKIEGILGAKGLEALVFLSGDSCTVVVKTTTLSERDVAQIGDAVRRIARISLQNITVVPTPR
ncbi:MAG TPA: SpoIIIAH-like family protein [Firmicutes bacterium]|nr:SpoIIIAH-like family protein [Candidatus Fermentithermobacillaceae bacterium]